MTDFTHDVIATLREPKMNAGVLTELRDHRKRAARKNSSKDAIDKRVTETFQLHLYRLWVATDCKMISCGMVRYQDTSKLFGERKDKGEYKASSMVLFIVVRRFLRYVRCNQKKLRIPYEMGGHFEKAIVGLQTR